MPHLGIDCRFASAFGGLGRYTREMTRALLTGENGDLEFVLFATEKNPEWLQGIDTRNYEVIHAPYPHYSVTEHVRFPFVLRSAGIDLLYSPHFNVPFFCPIPYVVTIHDLILHAYPNDASWFKQGLYRVVMRRAVKHARHIIAVSQFTKKELLQEYIFLKDRRVSVVGEGVDQALQKQPREAIVAVQKKYRLEKPYFLYVGNCKQHKNVDLLVRAFRGLKDSTRELVVVTGGKESENLHEGEGVRILRSTSEADLAALYSGALSFITASLYEGYCLPVAEAQACGCPVIASTTSAIPEIASSSTMLIEPTLDGIQKALKHPPQTAALWQPPRWEQSAQELRGILRAWIV